MAMLTVKVVPGASRDRVAGMLGDALKVQVSAPPEAGKANKAVLRVLAEFLNVKPDQLQIAKGQTQPRKMIEVRGMEQIALDALVESNLKSQI